MLLVSRYIGQAISLCNAVKDVVVDAFQSWIPTRICSVYYMPPGGQFGLFYQGSNWLGGVSNNMYAPHDGFYAITYWSGGLKHVVLSASLLSDALGIRGLSSWWAMSDWGVCVLLTSFMSGIKPDPTRIFAVMINGRDVTRALKPFVPSIVLDDNLTARAVCDLYANLSQVPHKKQEENTVVLIDYDLEQRSIVGDEHIFRAK